MRFVSNALLCLASADKPHLDGLHTVGATLSVPLTEARDPDSNIVPGPAIVASRSPWAANPCPRPSVRFGSRPFIGTPGRYPSPRSFQSPHRSFCAGSPTYPNGNCARAWRRRSSRTATPRAQGPDTGAEGRTIRASKAEGRNRDHPSPACPSTACAPRSGISETRPAMNSLGQASQTTLSQSSRGRYRCKPKPSGGRVWSQAK